MGIAISGRFRHENAHRFPGGHKTDVNPLQKQGQSQEGQDHPDKISFSFSRATRKKKWKTKNSSMEGPSPLPRGLYQILPTRGCSSVQHPHQHHRQNHRWMRATRPNPSPEELFPRMTEATPTPRLTMRERHRSMVTRRMKWGGTSCKTGRKTRHN